MLGRLLLLCLVEFGDAEVDGDVYDEADAILKKMYQCTDSSVSVIIVMTIRE